MTKYPIYRGDQAGPQADGPVELPPPSVFRQINPEAYMPAAALVDAVNVALLLGQPLLLTGEPGTGKTQLAYSVAWELGLGEPLKFETKSTSKARDLFYYYNSIGRFHAAQTGQGSQDGIDYITYNALGTAILRACKPEEVQAVVPSDFEHRGPRRSVVLLDEVDKAPRDFPNDILNEIEGMYFRVPELQNVEIRAEVDMQPPVVITSNSEKHLPDAFLRRCVYYHIEFPEGERLRQIVVNHLGQAVDDRDEFLSDALDLFFTLRSSESRLRKKPATGELLNWIFAMQRIAPADENPLRNSASLALQALGSLVKTREDQEAAHTIAEQWTANRSQ